MLKDKVTEKTVPVQRRKETLPYKGPLVRNRRIFSCQRCYNAKRKCDKSKPNCSRCIRAKVTCLYFSPTTKDGKYIALTHCKDDGHLEIKRSPTIQDTVKPSLQNILNTEINPQVSKKENQNFTLVISSTGEYSKFFPTCTFPFHDHQANLSMQLNFNEGENRSLSVFDFSKIVNPIDSIEALKSRLPNKEISDFLVEHFFSYIRPFVPIVDSEEFMYDYRNYWLNPEKSQDLNFLVIIFAIIFCSCTNIMFLNDLQTLNLYRPQKSIYLFQLDCKKVRADSFECIENLKHMLNSDSTPSISIIISLSLIYYLGSSNGFMASMQISSLVKYAQIYGLHRKLVNKSEGLPMRDIIYSFVWYLDGLAAYYSGFPPNMYYEIFQCDYNNMLQSKDLGILFLAGRLLNTKVWNRILFEFNKINKSEDDDFKSIEKLYLDTIASINQLNKNIMESKQANQGYKTWLVTETRLGLRKSALLLSALKCSKSYKQLNNYKSNITTDLVLQSMLLINESVYKVKLGMKFMKESIWFYRFAIPFQAMYIVLSHIQKYPNMELNFSLLNEEMEYTFDPVHCIIDLLKGDIRMKLVDDSIKTLSFLVHFWAASNVDRFENIIKFRNFVYDKILNENENHVVQQFETQKTQESQKQQQTGTLPHKSVHEPIKQFSYILTNDHNNQSRDIKEGPTRMPECDDDHKILDPITFDYDDAFAFLDEGSKFWFGDFC
jgi:hypothetical protein